MKACCLILWVLVAYTGIAFAEPTETGFYYVDSALLDVRLGPNLDAPVSNRLKKGQKIKVFDVENGWARISEYYDGSIEGQPGKVAMWVNYLNISKATRRDNANQFSMSQLEDALKASDDFDRNKDALLKVSKKLIESGRCSLAEFKSLGGWVRSTTHRPKVIYFTYCGGLSANNRIYFDLSKDEIFR